MAKVYKARAAHDFKTAGTRRARVGSVQTIIDNRLNTSKGTDVASGNNITLPDNGNSFDVTGTTAIMRINPTNWSAGAKVSLKFEGICTVHNNEGTDTSVAKSLILAGNTDMTTAANDVLSLEFDGTNWREYARATVSGPAALGAGAVVLSNMAANSIDSDQYVDGSIDTVHIADAQITADKLASNAVTTAKITAANVTTACIADSAVTEAKIADNAITSAKIGAGAVGTDDIADLAVTAGKFADGCVSAAKIASDAVTTVKILDANVTYAKIQDVAGLSLVGRSANTSGVTAAITGTDGQVARVSGTALGFGTIATAGIADANVTYAKIANGTGLSVIGRSANSAGVNADITGTDGQVCRVAGTALGFGTIATAGIADAAVTHEKIENGTGLSLIGRSANSAGVNADITGTDGQVCRVSGTSLGFGTIATAGIADAAVTWGKLAANVGGTGQDLSGAGAINLTTPVTWYTSTGAAQALTLADGTETGQRKKIIHVVDGGSGVITAGGALHLGHGVATITFTNVMDWVELMWNGTAWAVCGYAGAVIAT